MTTLKTTGKIIIILAFIASLNPYILIFTIPVFIVGVILIWASNLKLKVKALWTLLPIFLWYPAFFSFMYLSGVIGTATAQKLDFIFQPNFEGKVIIIENMSCGQPVKKENNREQLFIPENGVLLYQGELEDGYVNHRYYRLQSSGRKVELPERASYMFFEDEKQKPDAKVIGAWLLNTGVGYNGGENQHEFMNLLVASKDSADKFYEYQYTKHFEALADSLVNQCK